MIIKNSITKLDNIKREIFETKESYLAFRQAWKDYINAGKAKAYYVDREQKHGGRFKRSDLTPAHHLLFCILTEKDLSVTFKPSVNIHKCGFRHAYDSLFRKYMSATRIVDKRERTHDKEGINSFLEPFGETFTADMLIRLFQNYLKEIKLANVVVNIKEAA